MAQQRIILDRYAQIERLGSGATGTVDLCWDARIRRYVAIKRMPLSSTTPGAQVPGLAEARMAAALNHPNIVSVYDFEAADGEALLIMEAIEGPALSDILDETPPGQLDRDIIASIANSVASALSFAHSNNVLHLDVKPDNILVDLEGRTKLSDFGISELADARGLAFPAGGTIGYMPPEQLRAEELDQRCDVFALGMVVYEMLVGENPFVADTLDKSRKLVERFAIKPPSAVRADISAAIDDVVFAAIEPDWRDRYPDLAAFMRDLLPLLGNPKLGASKLKEAISADEDDARELATGAWAQGSANAGGGDVQGGKGGRREKRDDGRHRRALGAGGDIWGRLDPRAGAIARYAASFALCWWTSAIGLVASELLPTGWAFAAALLVGALAFVGHGVGACAAVAVLGAGIACNPNASTPLGCAIAALGIVWVVVSGRRSFAGGPCALSVVPAGLVWFTPISPVLAGYFLRPLHALSSTLLSCVLALCLAAETRSGSLLHFNLGVVAGGNDVAWLLEMVRSPAVWLVMGSWLVGTVLFSLLCSRETKISSIMGACALGASMLGAQVLAASLAAGQLAAPDLTWTVSTACATAIGICLGATDAPAAREGDT